MQNAVAFSLLGDGTLSLRPTLPLAMLTVLPSQLPGLRLGWLNPEIQASGLTAGRKVVSRARG